MEDLVGETSARLFAAGVPARRRRQGLRLLGALESVAGPDLVVRRPLADVAGEFGVPVEDLDVVVADLVTAGALRPLGGVWVLDAVEPPAEHALRLQDFLALADETAAEEPVADLVALRRSRRPAFGALAAAALVAVVLLGATVRTGGGQPVAAQRDTAARAQAPVSTTTAAPPAGAVTASVPARAAATSVAPSAGPTTSTTSPLAPCPDAPPVLDLGSLRNPSGVDVVVHTVVVNGVEAPLEQTVPAGAEAPAPVPPGAQLGRWEWLGCR